MHVLVVEDDIETARYLQKGLSESGHVVELIHDGADGLSLALDHRFDALVVDRMLPGLDGLALIETLRRKGRRTPVLILSALAQVDDRVEGLRAGGGRLPDQALRLLGAAGAAGGAAQARRQRWRRDPPRPRRFGG